MDHNVKSPNTADTLLQKLKQNIAQNDSDKESIAAEEAAAGQTVPAADLRPDYHRLCQAERERAEREAAAQAK